MPVMPSEPFYELTNSAAPNYKILQYFDDWRQVYVCRPNDSDTHPLSNNHSFRSMDKNMPQMKCVLNSTMFPLSVYPELCSVQWFGLTTRDSRVVIYRYIKCCLST